MAKKVILKDLKGTEVLPITRGELVIDSSGKQALHSNEFLATTSLPGLMSAIDKNKLDNFQGDTYELSGVVSDDKYITTLTSSKGVTTNAVIEPMQGATVDLAGKVGLVPAPLAGYQNKFLSGDGTWKSPTEASITAEDILEKLKTVDGSGSGLDADLLDGYNIESIVHYADVYDSGTVGLGKQAVTYWRRETSSGYTDTYGTSLHLFGAYSWANRLDISTSGNIFLYQGINTTNMTKIGQIAMTHSNVASATKLQTARTIFGQTFDGTQNVSQYVTDIYAIKFTGNYGIWKGNGFTGALTDSDIMYNAVTHYFTGNVGIGTTSPGYKLHVEGNVYSNNFISKVAIGTQPYACTSTTCNTNLNADMVDGYHASSFFKSYGTYGSDNSYDSDWGLSVVTFDPVVSGTYPENNPNITILNLGNNYARRKQLACTYNNNNIYYRRRTDSSWSGWVRLAIAGESYTKGDSDGRYYPISGNVNMSGDNKWIGSTMGGGTDYWRIGGSGTSDNGVCQITIGDNSNDYFQIVIADYSGTNYTALLVKAGGTYAPHFYESSDQRLKTNIQAILNKDNIPQIKEFDWKESGEHSYGLIAQELEEQGYSELVSTKDDGYKTVNYSAALSLIVGKLQVKIKELEKEIEILKNKN